MPTCQKMAFAKSPTFSITFLKCIASCWPIFIFGLHFPGTLIFVPCAKCFVFYTLRSRGAWGRPNVPKMPLVTFRFRRLDSIASAFGPKGWTFRRSEPPRGSHLAPQGPILVGGCMEILVDHLQRSIQVNTKHTKKTIFATALCGISCCYRATTKVYKSRFFVNGSIVGYARMKCQS